PLPPGPALSCATVDVAADFPRRRSRRRQMHEQWRQVDDYPTETLVGPDAALDAALARSEAAGLPAINVAPNQGKLLHLLARLRGARRILEIGTLGGYSTIWLARALPEDGRLLSLEVNEAHAA